MRHAQGKLSERLHRKTRIKEKIAVHIGIIPMWTVFFMKKWILRVAVLTLLAVLFWTGTLIADRAELKRSVLCVLISENSDSRDIFCLQANLLDVLRPIYAQNEENLRTCAQAKAYICENLAKIEAEVNRSIGATSSQNGVRLQFGETAIFADRSREDCVPSGVYDAIFVTFAGEKAKNSRCVVNLYSDGLQQSETMGGKTVRFLVLDTFGVIENFLHRE